VGAPVRPNMLNMPKSASGHPRSNVSYSVCYGMFIRIGIIK